MRRAVLFIIVAAVAVFAGVVSSLAQSDSTPDLLIRLPEYEKVAPKAAFATDVPGLKAVLGDRSELAAIELADGSQAVTAPYQAGKLILIDYSSPQAADDASSKLQQAFQGKAGVLYKRIGNSAAIVLDAKDAAAANALIDEIPAGKDIQWVGEQPKAKAKKPGVTVPQMAGVLFSSVVWLIAGGLVALAGGAFVGYLYYRRMMRHRAEIETFSDAGGITRLNLDGLTPNERLLNE